MLLAAALLLGGISLAQAAPPSAPAEAPVGLEITEFPVPRGSRPHDVAPAVDGGVWYTATFDRNGILWFTGQNGVYGKLNPVDSNMQLWSAPRGNGPYGITTTPAGDVHYASLAGYHIAKIDLESGEATPIDPPTTRQGSRRVWSDAEGRIWVSEWNAGQVDLYDPRAGAWREWKLPGSEPLAYAVYVDHDGAVWVTDFGANALVRFDPSRESFEVLPHSAPGANVRQLLGRPGEVWGAASGHDRLVVVYTR